ncbi:MAG: putative Long-chain fatty acid transport protein [Candidatus Gallionella acididurans]|uniref:Putative Long-chain fatty acid transport protein n=1 Tax=Candidatus Gallionella acididurans TaxID=1796491 RepID=A0A139BX52_9PROT|nr:MAG: putative Long-chain fatty acid transport protein [Candidatus Gallionella acididurans]
MKLLLYGTRYCHLCEQAGAVLHAAGLTTEYIDIAEDEALLEKYGMRIPVVRRADSGAELDWPFDEAALNVLAGRAANIK